MMKFLWMLCWGLLAKETKREAHGLAPMALPIFPLPQFLFP
jgi:hypothetical protein